MKNKQEMFGGSVKKVKLLLFLSFVCISSALLANDLAYAQQTLFTFSMNGVKIQSVFDRIEAESEFVFFYSDKVINPKEIVSVTANNETVTQILDKLLVGYGVDYTVNNRQITLKKKAPLPVVQQSKDGKEIKGIVKDALGEPLPGAAIQVKGTPRGVSTDVDGSFTIRCKTTDELIVTYLGMKDQTIKVGNKTEFLIVMEEQGDLLDEVTVVAFAKQKKESVISSVSTVKVADLKVPSSNLTTAFAGKIAGVIAYQRSGEPGQDNADFFIRGVTTFGTGKADPLILIDNVELSSSDLARLSPDDIASFSILKDATATALYGARGANGVILVTTKEGKEGKTSVSFRIENSISAPARDVEVASPLSFMKLHNEAVRTRDPLAPLPYSESSIAARENGGNPYVYPMVDWKELLFKDYTMNQRGNINLTGGGKKARYYVALSYSRDNGILSVDPVNSFNNNIQLNKYTVRSNVNMNLTNSTELAVRVSGTFDDYQGPIGGGAQMYDYAIKANPVLFPATFAPDEQSKYFKHVLFGNSDMEGKYMNPYAEMLRGYKEYQTTVVNAQLELKQDFGKWVDGLSLRVLANISRDSYFDLTRDYTPFYYSVGSYDKFTDKYVLTALNPTQGTDYLAYHEGAKEVSSSFYFEGALSYNKKFVEKHDVSGLLVFQARDSQTGNAGSLEASLPHRNLGLSGRFTYGYSDRYFGEFNFGYNASERFDKNHRWGFFPSAGLGWIISNESFWKDSKLSDWVQMLKLKATYGLVGNDNISSDRFFYLSNVNMNAGGYTFGLDYGEYKNGISISRYADSMIGWEVSHKMNLGFELKMFEDLEIQLDYFRERRTNILQTRADIPTIMGLQATPKANIGEAKGHGIDLSVDYQHIINKDWWITARGNFTFASSKYSKYEEPDYSQTTPWLTTTGQKLSQPLGLIAERLFIDEEDIKNSPKQTFGEYMPGDIKYLDINNDGIVDDRDRVYIGYPTTPEIIYGFGFSVGYKSFDISCFFQGSARSSFFIDPESVSPFVNSLDGKMGNNAVLEFIEQDHWSETNPNIYAAWPRLSEYYVDNNTKTSTWWMRDGSFLRLKSAEIGYTLDSKIARKIMLSNLRFYLSGTNLFCLSKFKLWDPEMGGDGLGYPIQRVLNLGLQVSF